MRRLAALLRRIADWCDPGPRNDPPHVTRGPDYTALSDSIPCPKRGDE